MQLVKFRIQNYKRIEETDWITLDNVTALVGGNETGKTSVLQALWKLKPGRENIVLDAQEEFPRHRYTSDYLSGGMWPVVTAIFELDSEVREQLVALDPVFAQCQQIECTSYYDHDPMIAFIPDVKLKSESAGDVEKLIGRVRKAIDKATPPMEEAADEEAAEAAIEAAQTALQSFQTAVGNLAERTLDALHEEAGDHSQAVLMTAFRDELEALSAEGWQREAWVAVLSDMDEIANRPDAEERFQQAVNLAWEAVPTFIYFDDYHLLESEVYIPEAIQRIAAGSTDPKVRSQWALFERAGFPIKEISNLAFRPDPSQPVSEDVLEGLFGQIRERAIIAAAAGRTITQEFSNWWHQHRHEIEFRVDGETFQIWVADNKYPMLIEFEGRSKGFRWFFTFYLVFSVETGHAHKNAILLLDEPGLHLYPLAQEELLQFFDELAQHNQIIYATHSPFMLDKDHLDRIRVVEERADGLVGIANSVEHSSGEAVYPVQARLSLPGIAAGASESPRGDPGE